MHNPDVPETLEGWSILHQMFRLRWTAVRALTAEARRAVAAEACALASGPGRDAGATALVQLLGHKGDLMFIHFRRQFDDLSAAQLAVARSRLHDYLEPSTSYVSMVELGMYEMTAKIHRDLASRGLTAGSDDFEHAFDAEMQTQRERVAARLFLEV